MTESARTPVSALIAAVRADKLVGRGTCSSLDECFEDDELPAHLGLTQATTPAEAVKAARDSEELYLENGTNQSSGEPDCPIVASYRAWKAERAADESGGAA